MYDLEGGGVNINVYLKDKEKTFNLTYPFEVIEREVGIGMSKFENYVHLIFLPIFHDFCELSRRYNNNIIINVRKTSSIQMHGTRPHSLQTFS